MSSSTLGPWKGFAAAATVATAGCLAALMACPANADPPAGSNRDAKSSTAAASATAVAPSSATMKPLMRDFIGLNTHTVQFRPALYQPVTRILRDYHNIDWDFGMDTSSPLKFPMSQNGVNWQDLYGSWRKAGYSIDVCVQFGPIKQDGWKDMPRDARNYGKAFATYFGPAGHNLAESAEIGNEPGNYSDESYRTVFENMARGMREGDPKLKIVTCATFAKKSGPYHKSLSTVEGLESLYDVINLHSYAQAEPYPTWRRSYPEDPKLEFLKDIDEVIAWRNAHAQGKQVWLTEFGWDSTTKPQEKEGTFKDWVGVTDTQQAQYIVRAYMVLSAMDLDRAYLYWFNDEDKASVHAASGLTRNFQPKPSFYAVAHLMKTLGEYRLSRVVAQKVGEPYVYEYQKGTDSKDKILAVWLPSGSGTKSTITLPVKGKVTKAERMPLASGDAEAVTWKSAPGGAVTLEASESPTYLWVH